MPVDLIKHKLAKDEATKLLAESGIEPIQEPETADEPQLSTQEESSPQFPRLPGQLGNLIDAITCDLPYEHKALSTLAYIGLKLSGRVRLASEPFLQPRFYACMVGPPGTGKSSAEKEVRRALFGAVLEGVQYELSIDSGPALVEALAENPRIIYAPDEMADAFEKAKQTATGRNSLFGEFLRLYESNETARRVVKKNAEAIHLSNVHFAMIGSATPERFERMWTGTSGASGGLQSRFVLSFSEKALPIIKTPSDEQALSLAVGELADILNADQPVIRLSNDAQDWIQDWAAFKDLSDSPRVLDMAKRFALVLAACNRTDEVDGETMRRALAFADYQIAVHERLMPRDAAGWVQAFENRIIAFFERHGRATERQMRQRIVPERYQGGYGSFQQACRNLVGTGKLKQAGKTRKNTPIWELD
jgi:hypothetical protein